MQSSTAIIAGKNDKGVSLKPVFTNLAVADILKDAETNVEALSNTFKSTPKPTQENWIDVLKCLKVSLLQEYEEPKAFIEFSDNVGGATPFATFGNFSVIIGKAKSRKTFLISLLLAFCLKLDLKGFIKVFLPENKSRIILIDTEQSQHHISKVIRRILKVSGTISPNNFDVYGLRTLPPLDRLFLIEQLIYSTDDLGVLVIDGLRDLIHDINSPEEATMITSKLLKWTEERNIHIITVLHQNKGDNNARGHVGTEAINKAESVISAEKKGDITVVSPEFVRGKDFNSFAFGVDPEGIPYLLDEYTNQDEVGKKKLTAFDIPKETHLKVLSELFTDLNAETVRYKDLETHLKVKFQSNAVDLTNSQVIEFIAYYKQEKILQDTGGKGAHRKPVFH